MPLKCYLLILVIATKYCKIYLIIVHIKDFTLNVIITFSKANFRYYQLQTFRVIATFLYILYIRQMVIFLLFFQWLRILLEIYDISMIGTIFFQGKLHRFHYFYFFLHSLVTGIGSTKLSVVKNLHNITKLSNCKEK